MRDEDYLRSLIKAENTKWEITHEVYRMWTYHQRTGKLFDAEGRHVSTGYAGGNGGKHPEGVNNPEMQNVKMIGPLPQGFYTFGEVVLKSHLGPFAIPLIPDKENEMYQRSAFYCHGDRKDPPFSASDGCIIQPRAIREMMYNSKDHILKVISGDET